MLIKSLGYRVVDACVLFRQPHCLDVLKVALDSGFL